VVTLLRPILRHVSGKVVVVWDGASIHRCPAVKQGLADGGAIRLTWVPRPGYAAELNPDAGVWRWLKRGALGNVYCDTLHDVRYEVRLARARLRHRKEVLHACIRRPGYMH